MTLELLGVLGHAAEDVLPRSAGVFPGFLLAGGGDLRIRLPLQAGDLAKGLLRELADVGEPRKRNETADGRRFTQIIKELC